MRNVLIVGGTRGIGRALVDEYVAAGDRVWATSRAPMAIPGATVIEGVELTDDAACLALRDHLRQTGVAVLRVEQSNTIVVRIGNNQQRVIGT